MTQAPPTRTITWQYGLLDPLDWGEDCEHQLRLQNMLWNALVEIERTHRGRISALVSADPEVAALEGAIAAVDERITGLFAERNTQRQRLRRRLAIPEINDQVTRLREERRALFSRLKGAKTKARDAQRRGLAKLADQRYRAITIARQQSGLWWGNYNAVCASFDVALRALGPGEEVRFHRFNGGGRITNQIQGGISSAALFNNGHSQVRIVELDPANRLLNRGAGRRGRLKGLVATVWAEGRARRRLVTWPIVLHRPFPEKAIIKTVTITRRRAGAVRWRWAVDFACAVPSVPETTHNTRVGVDIGWRKIAGGLRVATLATAAGGIDHVILPQSWLERREAAARVQSEADELLNMLLPQLRRVDDVPADLAALWTEALPADRERARSSTLAELVREWRHAHRDWRPALREALEPWLHQRIKYANLADKLAVGRREIFRIRARSIAERFGIVAVNWIGIRRLAANRETPPETRRMRSWAAPYDLVAEIRRAVGAAGGRFLAVQGPTTLLCHYCGAKQTARTGAHRADLIWRCENENCGRLWDQDENAAKNLLAAATGAGVLAAKDPEPKKIKVFTRARITRKGGARKVPSEAVTDARA
jgi:hypothetical protein